ncbi:unnamed protein product [Durusdinium trenchii]|uniref:APPLE domain-containing protein n=2 Tax=Durusdinium trenchii TaxID=1381693 RepID=A0ABP0PE76_9DINO
MLSEPLAVSAPAVPKAWSESGDFRGTPKARESRSPVEFESVSNGYLSEKYEALQRQLASTQRTCAEQLQRQERLQLELRDTQAQDALVSELVARQASLVSLREVALSARQEAMCQAGRLRDEQLAGARAEQRCAQLAEECRQGAVRYDQAVQQLAEQDREIARHRFEAMSNSRRLRQTNADVHVVKEDLRIESQRQLLAQNELQELEQSLQLARHHLRLAEEDADRARKAVTDKKKELIEADGEVQSLGEAVKEVQQEKQRSLQGIALAEDQTQKLESQFRVVQQDLGRTKEENERRVSDSKAQTLWRDSLHVDLYKVENKCEAITAEVQACRQSIAELEAAVAECKVHSVQAFREKDTLTQKVQELKAEQQQLDGLCLALRRASHAEELAMEDLQAELQMAFVRKESLMEEIAANTQACSAIGKQLDQLRPDIAEADERSGSLEMRLVQKSKDLEGELQRERALRQNFTSGLVNSTAALASPAPKSPSQAPKSPSPLPASQCLAPPLTSPGTMPLRRLH